MRSPKAFALVGLLAGLIFGAGLVVGGMTNPNKVQGFLDFSGDWDPTLVFVMGGAVALHFFAYRLIKGWSKPVLAPAFQVPSRKDIDARLVLGAAIFGMGWGLGGLCPGPALTSLPSGGASVAVFVAAMLASSWLTGWLESRASGPAAHPPHPNPDRPRRVPAP